MRVYLAAPLFTLAEREFNARLASELAAARPSWNITLPQERAKAFIGRPDFVTAVFNQCLSDVRESDVVVAVLDGPDSDSGTCIELGFARAVDKAVIGIRTDFRGSEDRGVNLMVSNSCDSLLYCDSMTTSTHELGMNVVDAIEHLNLG